MQYWEICRPPPTSGKWQKSNLFLCPKLLDHSTFIVRDLARATQFFCEGLGGRQVYDSGPATFSLSRERFFLVGGVWLAAMEGDAPAERSYQHLAFKVGLDDLALFESRLRGLGVDIKPPRPRVDGEGLSLYFHDFDNHLFI
ncbi:catechol 2,3-dioxygenase-like lactoylglutathione lyase family enzyme [Oxalobacteraceae bacterium GrIS 1.11]